MACFLSWTFDDMRLVFFLTFSYRGQALKAWQNTLATRATLKAATAVASAQSLRSLGSPVPTYISWPRRTRRLRAHRDFGCVLYFRDFCFGFSLCCQSGFFFICTTGLRCSRCGQCAMLLGQLPVGQLCRYRCRCPLLLPLLGCCCMLPARFGYWVRLARPAADDLH